MNIPNFLRNIILFILVVFVIWGFYYPNLEAQWGIIDDHEVFSYLGDDLELQMNEILPVLVNCTEIGNYGKTTRYRPAYHFIRILESWLWGAKVHYWYFFRFLLLVTSVFLLWKSLQPFLGTILGGLLTLMLISGPWMGNIFSRLGPSETYAFCGLSIYIYSSYKLLEHDGLRVISIKWWSIHTIACLVCIGSKENFLFLLPLVWVGALYAMYKQKRVLWPAIGEMVLVTALSALIVGSLILGLKAQGSDVYSNPVDFGSRINIAVSGLLHFNWIPLAFAILMLSCSLVLYWFGNRARIDLLITPLINFVIFESILFLLWMFQYIFYNGNLPWNSRYQFPIYWFEVLSIALAIYYVFVLSKNYDNRLLKVLGKYKFQVAFSVGFLFFLSYSGGTKFDLRKIYESAVMNKEITTKFSKKMKYAVETLTQDPDKPVLFEIHHISDYEPVISVFSYFNAYRVKNPRFLKVNLSQSNNFSLNHMNLLKTLTDAEGGKQFHRKVRFIPLQSADLDTDSCYVLGFSKEPASPCTSLGKIWDYDREY